MSGLGYECWYSGNTRTMYVIGISKFELDTIIDIADYPFNLVAQSGMALFIES